MIKTFYFKQTTKHIQYIAHSLNVRHFYLTNRYGPIRCYFSSITMKEYAGFPKAGVSPSDYLVPYPGHLGGFSLLCRDAVSVFYNFSRLAQTGIEGRVNSIKLEETELSSNFLGVSLHVYHINTIRQERKPAQLAVTVEYTDCTFAEGWHPAPTNVYPGHNIKQCDSMSSVMLEHWEMQSTISLSPLPGPL